MAVSGHGDQINFSLGRMVQYLLDIISITDMGIYLQSFGSEAIL
jgi:hypothetical protein